ncbi:ATP-binding SpoIIE family protein phosphatase [Salinibius halmophilus]|uniref:ATP-binding SpoIIE family protein phosphatase n=1 Tax=Salinibius halmophilus TaxID=1853216 RepID=UPI000E66E015|nr:fused response regulator/phosphatase [Salinibius halmophilus]
MTDSLKLKVLVADDSETDRMILSAIVRQEGHEVLPAKNGKEAVNIYRSERPDIVLLDALMPVMDGFEAARTIKAIAGTELVPIIFLTSLQDPQSLVRSLESGGDDFLSKPYKRVIIKAKLTAFGRMRSMHAAIQANHRQLLIEQQVAKRVFDNVAHQGCLESAGIRYSLSPLSVFNGDTLLAQRRPDGGLSIFLGDFTGHGLPAAIGAMPLAETFYGMTAKGFELEDIVKEINLKLNNVLPMGVFCCAAVAHIDFINKSLRIWVGGLPDLCFWRESTKEAVAVASSGLPLGIVGADKFSPKVEQYRMDDGDRLLFWSDGIHEARNSEGELFGEERLWRLIRGREEDSIFDAVLNGVNEYIGQNDREDDITLAEVTMQNVDLRSMRPLGGGAALEGVLNWQQSTTFDAKSLRHYNPLPLMLHNLSEIPWVRQASGELYTMLAELYSNALEHGVLELDSQLKASTEGFATYYAEREQRLKDLKSGFVRISFAHQFENDTFQLVIEVEDSGNGFDWQSTLNNSLENKKYSGRGVPLISAIADKVEYQGNGNFVRVTLRKPEDGDSI